MLSMKQAASRPRPPLPSAASGSARRIRSRSTPRSPSAAQTVLGQAEIAQHVAATGGRSGTPATDNRRASCPRRGWRGPASQRWMTRSRSASAVATNQSRAVAAAPCRPQRQLGEHGTLDFAECLLARSLAAWRQRAAQHTLKLAPGAGVVHAFVFQGPSCFRMIPVPPSLDSARFQREPWRDVNAAGGMERPPVRRPAAKIASGYRCAAAACQSALNRRCEFAIAREAGPASAKPR